LETGQHIVTSSTLLKHCYLCGTQAGSRVSFDLPRQLLPFPDLARKIEGDSACRVTIESVE